MTQSVYEISYEPRSQDDTSYNGLKWCKDPFEPSGVSRALYCDEYLFGVIYRTFPRISLIRQLSHSPLWHIKAITRRFSSISPVHMHVVLHAKKDEKKCLWGLLPVCTTHLAAFIAAKNVFIISVWDGSLRNASFPQKGILSFHYEKRGVSSFRHNKPSLMC